ncbi:MAG: DUF2834 domain-containing protein [Anaerolineales bacterium]
MKNLKIFYIISAILGTVIPWVFFAQFFIKEGFNLSVIIQNLFANGAAGGFSADVLISIVIFLVWSFADAKKHTIQNWWLVLPASFTVGLSLALPLYLILRLQADEKSV